jgi:hypothetical protein
VSQVAYALPAASIAIHGKVVDPAEVTGLSCQSVGSVYALLAAVATKVPPGLNPVCGQ